MMETIKVISWDVIILIKTVELKIVSATDVWFLENSHSLFFYLGKTLYSAYRLVWCLDDEGAIQTI